MNTPPDKRLAPSAPPRVVAISGIIFAALYFASLVFVRLAVPASATESGVWLADATLRSWVRFSLNLIPFTGIAFLWFMGVLRNRVGALEDRFFATVFLGSGLLFVAMVFVAAAVAQGLMEASTNYTGVHTTNPVYAVGRSTIYALMNTFAMKMAAVFIIVTSTIGLRTAVLPRWLTLVGYALALVMLLTIAEFAWIALLFPSWVFLLSTYILVADLSQARQEVPNAKPEAWHDESSARD